MQKYRGIDIVSHTYANFVEVPVPVGDDDDVDKDLGTPEVNEAATRVLHTPVFTGSMMLNRGIVV